MKKEEALKIILNSAKEYHKNLDNNNLLFISAHPDNPFIFEARFLPRNFLHLTGVVLDDRNNPNSANFYFQCLNGRLSINEFSLSKDGQTEKKLQVLPQLMKIHKTAKMVGDFNMSGLFLSTDKLAGGTFGCLGFVQAGKYYSPNTALNRDIRQVVPTPNRILAILRKPINQENYTELCYTAKGSHLDKIKLPSDISDKIAIPEFHQNYKQASVDKFPTPPPQELSFKDIANKAMQQAGQHNASISQQMDKSINKLDLSHR